MKDSMFFGNMRWVRCLVSVVSVLAFLTGQGFGEESPEIEELRALLEALEARVAVSSGRALKQQVGISRVKDVLTLMFGQKLLVLRRPSIPSPSPDSKVVIKALTLGE